VKVYRVRINGSTWGDIKAPTARAARDAAKREWQAFMRDPIRDIECFEIED